MQKLIRGIGIQPMLLLMGCLAPMVSLAAQEQGMTGDSGAGPIKKKLINRGWGVPSVEEFRDHIKEIEASPFDGTAIKFYLKDDEGKTVVVFGAGKNQPWKAEWFQPSIDILKKVKSEKRAESFISLSLAVPPANFADAFLIHGKDVHSDVYTDPPLEGPLVDRLRQATMTALDAVDEYVWVFDERNRFWETTNKRTDPYYWDDFISGAAAKLEDAKDPAKRQLANAAREFSITENKSKIREIPMRNLLVDPNLIPLAKPKPGDVPVEPVVSWEVKNSSGTLERATTGYRDSGSLSLKTTTEGMWTQSVEISPLTFYKARVGVRQIGEGKPELRLVWLDEAGKEILSNPTAPATSPKEAWAKIETLVQAPRKAKTLSLQLAAKGQNGERDLIWFDNAELYRVSVN